MSLEVCDVDADGECFYRCLVRCLQQDAAVWSGLGLPEEEWHAILCLRGLVARCVRDDQEVGAWIHALVRLYKEAGSAADLADENPLLNGARCLKDVSYNITVGRAWASQVEVMVAQRETAGHGVALVVLEAGCASSSDQLLAALDKTAAPRCAVLVRVRQCHYCYLALGTRRVFHTAWLVYRAAVLAMLDDPDDPLF